MLLVLRTTHPGIQIRLSYSIYVQLRLTILFKLFLCLVLVPFPLCSICTVNQSSVILLCFTNIQVYYCYTNSLTTY